MTPRTRTATARLLRTYRCQRDTYTRQAQAEPAVWRARLYRDMADYYRTLLMGAVSMLKTIRDDE